MVSEHLLSNVALHLSASILTSASSSQSSHFDLNLSSLKSITTCMLPYPQIQRNPPRTLAHLNANANATLCKKTFTSNLNQSITLTAQTFPRPML